MRQSFFYSVDPVPRPSTLTGMCKLKNSASLIRNAFGSRTGARLRLVASLMLLTMLLGVCLPARADLGDDQYLQIYSLIQQADDLKAGGSADRAKAKYQDALTQLKGFRKDYPNWNPKLVAYRLNDLAQKLADLSEKPRLAAAEETGTNAPQAKSSTQAVSSTSTTQVKLLEAGAEPRKALRLHPAAGDKQALTVTLKMAMETKIGEMPGQAMKLPAMAMKMDVTVKSVSDQGDITYELVMGDTTVADDAGDAGPLAEVMKAALGGAKGMTGTGTVSSRGLTKGMEFKVPSGADAQTRQVMEQMRESFASMAAALPEEAVGPGARWEVRLPRKSQGMTIDEIETCELVSVDGERLTTKGTITQRAANQKVESPAMPGLKVDVTKMTGTGTSQGTLDLGKLMPTAGVTELHSETDMAMNMGGQKQTITTRLDLNARLESK